MGNGLASGDRDLDGAVQASHAHRCAFGSPDHDMDAVVDELPPPVWLGGDAESFDMELIEPVGEQPGLYWSPSNSRLRS
jgi:hypothetical protein